VPWYDVVERASRDTTVIFGHWSALGLTMRQDVLALDTDFDGCMRIVQEVTQDNTIYLANSMNSLRIEGQKTVCIEIVQQLGWHVPDWIVLPSGNLGNISALAKGLALAHDLGVIDRLPRLAAAQAELANPLYKAYKGGFERLEPLTAGPTAASAIRIGNPVSYERAVQALRRFDGVVEQASEDELADAAALADRAGLYACPHTGVALAVVRKLVRQGIIALDQRVVRLNPAGRFPTRRARFRIVRVTDLGDGDVIQ
jgi:threonine synthase